MFMNPSNIVHGGQKDTLPRSVGQLTAKHAGKLPLNISFKVLLWAVLAPMPFLWDRRCRSRKKTASRQLTLCPKLPIDTLGTQTKANEKEMCRKSDGRRASEDASTWNLGSGFRSLVISHVDRAYLTSRLGKSETLLHHLVSTLVFSYCTISPTYHASVFRRNMDFRLAQPYMQATCPVGLTIGRLDKLTTFQADSDRERKSVLWQTTPQTPARSAALEMLVRHGQVDLSHVRPPLSTSTST